MQVVEYFSLAIKKKLQGGIVIPAECIFEEKTASGPGSLISTNSL